MLPPRSGVGPGGGAARSLRGVRARRGREEGASSGVLRGWPGFSVALSGSWNYGRRGRGWGLLHLWRQWPAASAFPHSLHRAFVGLEFRFLPSVGAMVHPGTSSCVVLERPCHLTLAKPALLTYSRLSSSAALNTEGDVLVALAVPTGLCNAHPHTSALAVDTSCYRCSYFPKTFFSHQIY